MENVSIRTTSLGTLGEKVKEWQAVTIAVCENHRVRIVNTILAEDLLCTDWYIADCSNLTGMARIILSASDEISEAKFTNGKAEFTVSGKKIIFSKVGDEVEFSRLRLKENKIEFDGASYNKFAKEGSSEEVYVLDLRNTYITQRDKVKLFRARKMNEMRRRVSPLERVTLYYEVENGEAKNVGLWSIKNGTVATSPVEVVSQIHLT